MALYSVPAPQGVAMSMSRQTVQVQGLWQQCRPMEAHGHRGRAADALQRVTSASSCNVRASVRFWITTGAGRALPKSINTAW